MKKVIVRAAKETDALLEAASCIYLTDPYIYPGAFGEDASIAAYAIAELMAIEGNLFHWKNLVLAFCDGKICGVLLYNRQKSTWDIDQCLHATKSILPNAKNFTYVSKTYFQEEALSPPHGWIKIVACCMLPEYRGKGIGSMLLSWLIKENLESSFCLDVLADNQAAVSLYQDHAFKIAEQFKGFSMNPEARPSCYKMIRTT